MALTKSQKNEVVSEMSGLLSTSKMTVIANYKGTTVKGMQQLRRQARQNGTIVKVAKNRLVRLAINQTESLKNVDTSTLEGMLLYAFNSDDEVAPAQVVDVFNKQNQTLEFIGAISADGKFLTGEEVKALAILPSKSQLLAQVLAILATPINDAMNSLSGDIHGLLDGLSVKAGN
ncbi:MAG: 50S ribosomal protein L10 [Candidatus Saccharimonadales bacterium]